MFRRSRRCCATCAPKCASARSSLADLLDGAGAWSDAASRVQQLKFLAKLADDIDGMIATLDD